MAKKIIPILLLSLSCFVSIYPVIYLLNVAFSLNGSFSAQTLSLWPHHATLENFRVLLWETDFLLWMKNSIIVSAAVVVTGVTLAALAGYALSRFEFRGRKTALLTLLISQSFPATMLLLPFYILLAKLNLIDSYFGLFLIYSSTALPFCIWQMKSFYDTVPKELEEAARIDGCTPFVAYRKIIVPLSLPSLAITSLFSFLTAWSEYAVAAVVIQDPALYTLPLGLKSFQASLATQWGLYAAGALIVSVPVVAVFLFLNRFLISGMTAGSVKG
jgi:arabinogalactan oligomer/maltooligosaccharide transport system permease protein